MQIVLTGPEKRQLEATLRRGGFSHKESRTAVRLVADFLAQCDAAEGKAEGWKIYWRDFARTVFKPQEGNV